MDRFLELSVFVAVAEEEGFAAAARRLEMSPPPVTRAVNSLEERLGTKLLNRSTRHVRLTDAGRRYLPDARRLLSELHAADEAVTGVNSVPRGSLHITAPVTFGTLHVVPGVADYMQRYPDTQVSVALLDRVVNLLEEGFDAGIRIGQLPDSGMYAVKLGSVRSVVCTSPGYIKGNGLPKKPEQLKDHQVVSIGNSITGMQWKFERNGNAVKVQLKPRLSVSTVGGTLAAVKAGYGIARVLSYQVEEPVRDGSLQLILEDYEPASIPVHIVHREGRAVSSKLRAFIDLMVERLRGNAMLNSSGRGG